MMKTYVAEEMPELFWQLIAENGWNEFFCSQPGKEAEIIIIRTNTKIDREYLTGFPDLKLLIRAGSGYDNIDIKAALEMGIHVCNTPEANAISAYEHTLSLIFALLKQHRKAQKNILNGMWKFGLQPNWEFSDLKALIVGVGRVGSRIARALKCFGAEVRGVDPYLTQAEWEERNIRPCEYAIGLKWCNLISYHCPLTHETSNYFNENTLTSLQHPVWLINTARGGIVCEMAVKKGLQNNRILGFAADVFSVEPFLKNELSNLDQVILTPHIGSFTERAKERLSVETLAAWKAFASGRRILNPIIF